MTRIRIHHSTSQPYRFFGREAELAVLDKALHGAQTSVLALIGPGGQGKTAIVQHWLESVAAKRADVDGVFLWSFYRGKDVDLFLRELSAFVLGWSHTPEVSATWCVDHLLPMLRRERLAIVLDGTEVVQYDNGPWFGRFIHPELGRLVVEIASTPSPGVVLLTTRFPLPELDRRAHAQMVSLDTLDYESARALLRSVGTHGDNADLDQAADWAGRHAKAVELLGTLLARFHAGDAQKYRCLQNTVISDTADNEEQKVARVLSAYRAALPAEAQDILALATAFRDPPAEHRLMDYAVSEPVVKLLHQHWQRTYRPFRERGREWVSKQLNELIYLRLLERVSLRPGCGEGMVVIDAHPLVRRAFDPVLGTAGGRYHAEARAGFLYGRPDRRPAANLDEAREEIELFHAYCDAGLWSEADRTLAALDRPRYRFLAPALEKELTLRFFPDGNWRQPPLWPDFQNYRALAICFEMLGFFEDAVHVYREQDAALRGDAWIALGQLTPLLTHSRTQPPWQMLWQAYRAHALCLTGSVGEAVALARSLVPTDVYEWTQVFETLLRAGRLDAIDMHSFLYRPPRSAEHRWSELARQRMKADYLRLTDTTQDLGPVYAQLLESYDQAGLPYERALTRLSLARWRLARNETTEAARVNAVAQELARRYRMRIVEIDTCEIAADIVAAKGDSQEQKWRQIAQAGRKEVGYSGPGRP